MNPPAFHARIDLDGSVTISSQGFHICHDCAAAHRLVGNDNNPGACETSALSWNGTLAPIPRIRACSQLQWQISQTRRQPVYAGAICRRRRMNVPGERNGPVHTPTILIVTMILATG